MKRSITLSLILCLLILFPGWSGCKKNDDNPDYLNVDCTGIDANQNTYNLSIKAILDVTCALSGCHDAATQSMGVNLSTYAGAKTAFESNKALCAINHGSGCQPMPKNGAKLPVGVINILSCWAKNGYKQ